jgi:hypothetical protein
MKRTCEIHELGRISLGVMYYLVEIYGMPESWNSSSGGGNICS